jgi:hypothetical protein
MLVEAYDHEHHGIDAKGGDPLTMLKYVMAESDMTQADLA